MFDLKLDSKGKKLNQGDEMYDLSLDRREISRRGHVKLSLSGKLNIDRRHTERRTDNRPLTEFPYLS